MNNSDEQIMEQAILLGINGMKNNEGGPFGAVVVKDGKIIGRGNNKVILLNDPTAHAEIVAIRDACAHLNSFQLTDCILYTSCEPCPMCLGSIFWARPKLVYYGCTKVDAAKIGFDDNFIYEQLQVDNNERKIPLINIHRDKALIAFEEWTKKQDKTQY